MKKQALPIHNLLMRSYSKPLFNYKADGVYILSGPYSGQNLNKLYKKDNRIIDYLEAIIDNDASTYKMKWITSEVIKELLKSK
jgi:hypothetical protein